MNQNQQIFLDLYKHSLTEADKPVQYDLSEIQWHQILRIADIHRVYPMILEVVWNSFEAEDDIPPYFKTCRNKAVKQTCDQAVMSAEFLNLYRFLEGRNLKPVVVKGIICRAMYPFPEQRSSSDEDLMIPADQFEEYHKALIDYGLHLAYPDMDIYEEHEISYCNSKVFIELHKSPFPPESEAYGDLNRYFTDIESRKISENIYGVPVWTMEYTDHLFYQICHAYKHFLNCGIGIRLVSDIVLFSICHHDQIEWNRIIKQCKEINAYHFMSSVYRIGEKYLYPEVFPSNLRIIWNTEEAEESELLEDILNGGIYGTSSEDRLHSSNITLGAAAASKAGRKDNSRIKTLFPSMQYMKKNYPYLRKLPLLLPFAWLQRIIRYLSRKNDNNPSEALRIGEERVRLMKQYRIVSENSNEGSWLKRLYKKSHKSSLSPLLSPLFDLVSAFEYWILNLVWYIQGFRYPDSTEAKNVKENVTFIFKSFERQKLAKGLCKNISGIYPGVSIIVADDSRVPLEVDLPNVKVINMTFNSGLSAGLKAALDEVRTPYTVRLDDDELLTIRSHIHRELKYLMEHPDIDLVGFGFTTSIRCRNAQRSFDEYYNQSMDDAPNPLQIPHKTVLDEKHTVLGKVPNIYICRTEKLKEVNFDPNIRVIDHHDFFWRAAGIITSAAALDTVVFHRHNPYVKGYNAYRSDYKADLDYIKENRNKEKRQNETD